MTTNKKRSVALVLTTSPQDIYTVPSAFKSEVDSIFVSNGSDLNIRVTLQWYSALNTTSYDIMDAVELKPRSIIQITNPLYLERNDKITGFTNVGSNAITVTVRTQENFGNYTT